jgi:hypothetical protein
VYGVGGGGVSLGTSPVFLLQDEMKIILDKNEIINSCIICILVNIN